MPKTVWLSPKEASLLFPTNPDSDTVRGWMTVGVMIPGGKALNIPRIILKSISIGGRIFTTAAWIRKFLADCQRPITSTKTKKAKTK